MSLVKLTPTFAVPNLYFSASFVHGFSSSAISEERKVCHNPVKEAEIYSSKKVSTHVLERRKEKLK